MKDAVAASARKRVRAEFTLAFLRAERLAPGIRHTIRQAGAEGQSASERADHLRRSWRSAPGAIQDIVGTLEAHGIPCFRRDLVGTKANALVATSGKHRAMVFIDLRPDVEDATWAIAHELGHLALHDTADRSNEDSADEFAGEFLAPASTVRELLIAGKDVNDLPEAFAVPPAKFAVHARRSRLITAADYRRLRTLSTPPWDRVGLRPPTRIADAIDQRLGAGESIDDIAASASLTADELRRDYL
ncbi:ImmA/IrrE family metallo-endopeptidase [Microbacterium maritypicum]|uniref:ImmA/IrrE family metallo-endopeptidase n=1 Tax=Microbacterium maritypicum TaxID=33918 RepID=UPI00380A5BC8